MKKLPRLTISVCLLASCLLSPVVQASPPNFVLILADDLGYGDLGCYGGNASTPHLDRLAQEGIRFTDFHSNGPMCSATRAALLTGMYQNRFGREFEGALGRDPHLGLPLEAVTLPELLKGRGYNTAIYGKWHLGNRLPLLPTRQGFDEFRGLLTGDGDHFTHIARDGIEDWWHDEKLEKEEGYTADLLTKHSIDFLERNQNHPFFLYVPHLVIHFPWQGPNDPPQRHKGGDYSNDKWGKIPDRSNVSPHSQAMIEALDKSVGSILEALKRLDLEENTFVFFTSDNGGYRNYSGGFKNISSNGPLRGQKTELYEGGHRVPAIARWPSRIKPAVCDETVLTFDLLPTFLKLADAPPHAGDGVEIGSLLFEGKALAKRTLFWRKDDVRAARKGPWKLMAQGESPTIELYNLDQDIGESKNVAEDHSEIVQELIAQLKSWESSLEK